jgi:hypothetical protein
MVNLLPLLQPEISRRAALVEVQNADSFTRRATEAQQALTYVLRNFVTEENFPTVTYEEETQLWLATFEDIRLVGASSGYEFYWYPVIDNVIGRRITGNNDLINSIVNFAPADQYYIRQWYSPENEQTEAQRLYNPPIQFVTDYELRTLIAGGYTNYEILGVATAGDEDTRWATILIRWYEPL